MKIVAPLAVTDRGHGEVLSLAYVAGLVIAQVGDDSTLRLRYQSFGSCWGFDGSAQKGQSPHRRWLARTHVERLSASNAATADMGPNDGNPIHPEVSRNAALAAPSAASAATPWVEGCRAHSCPMGAASGLRPHPARAVDQKRQGTDFGRLSMCCAVPVRAIAGDQSPEGTDHRDDGQGGVHLGSAPPHAGAAGGEQLLLEGDADK